MYRPIVRRFAFFHTLFLSLIDHIVCTVTCRQFPNLTFAPRKTCHIGSNLTFHSYHATAIDIIHGLSQKSKNFFDFLSKKRKMKRSILFHSFYNRKILLYTTITLSQLFLWSCLLPRGTVYFFHTRQTKMRMVFRQTKTPTAVVTTHPYRLLPQKIYSGFRLAQESSITLSVFYSF